MKQQVFNFHISTVLHQTKKTIKGIFIDAYFLMQPTFLMLSMVLAYSTSNLAHYVLPGICLLHIAIKKKQLVQQSILISYFVSSCQPLTPSAKEAPAKKKVTKKTIDKSC